MVKPLSLVEQARSKVFDDYEQVAILFAATNFDEVLKEQNGEYVQMYGDIKQATQDITEFKVLLN